MDEERKSQFSLRNMFLMMLPLAVFCALVVHSHKQDAMHGEKQNVVNYIPALVLFVAMAAGALYGGWKGMGKGFTKAYFWMVVCWIVLIVGWFMVQIVILTIQHFWG
jgi:hypothetical protein